MLIASLKKLSSEHYLVTDENGHSFKTTLGVIIDMRLSEGISLTESQSEELKTSSIRSLAREQAILIASRRMMSGEELRRKLYDKGIDPETAQWCIEWMKDHSLLNDTAYAEALVRHYSDKGYGIGRIRQEFFRRGIPRDVSDIVLDSINEDDDVLDKLVQKGLEHCNSDGDLSRLTAKLIRRGYSYESVKNALKRADFNDY